MKLFKSLLLASATGLVAVSGASAADLGAKKPSPVEYVRACYNPLWGTSGGFIIPGTQTCVRVFGRARFDAAYVQQFNRTSSPMGYRGGLDVGLDAITPSEFGNVRAFAQIGMMYRSGNQTSGTNARLGFANNGTGAPGTGNPGQTEFNYTGFIQFAGFTMGRTSSFFATVGGAPEIIGTQWRSSPGNVNTIAYTAQLGNGFLATIAIEDPATRRFGVHAGSFLNGLAINTPNVAAPFGAAVTAATLVGNRMPNFVAALRVDQAWGSAELSGIVNEVAVVGIASGATNLLPAGTVAVPSAKYGFAINAGLKINLPMIAAGDNLTLNAVYSEGSVSAGGYSNPYGYTNGFFNVGGVSVNTPDAVISATGNLRLTKTAGVAAGFQHFWAPTLSSTVFGSYAQVDVSNTTLSVSDTLRDYTYWNVGLNTIWQPVRGLNIALEGAYVNLDPKGRMVDVNKNTTIFNAAAAGCNFATGVGCRLKSSDSQFITRLRVTRDF